MVRLLNSFTDPIAAWLGSWSAVLGTGSIVLRIALSFFLAAIIGCERANKRHAAGLRTFILVSLGATVGMLTDVYLAGSFGVTIPVLSLATGIGISAISTHSILFSSRSQIKGLTTAVALWACSILGLTIGCGLYAAALIGFAAMLACLYLLPQAETYLKDRSNYFEIHLELKEHRDLYSFITTLRKLGLRVDDIESNPAYANSGLSVFSISLTIVSPELKKYKKHREIIAALQTLEYVSYIEEIQ